MDLRSLHAFLTVAEELNFRRAAERLHMSQPPLTRLIAALEKDLRVRLFDRNTKSVALTRAGRLLLKEAPLLLDRAETIERKIREIGESATRPLKVGVTASTFQSWLIDAVKKFEKKNPKIEIELITGFGNSLLKRFHQRDLDFICIETTPGALSDYASLPIEEGSVGAMVPKTHPLAKKRSLRMKDLEGETIIVHPRHEHAHVYESQEEAFRKSGIRHSIYTKKTTESCPILVAQGKGIVLARKRHIGGFSANATFIPLVDSSLRFRLELLWNENPQIENQKRLVSFLKDFKRPSQSKSELRRLR